ncbi:MAG TPA: hypothetical protein VFB68_12710 [Xanthobacteraceae bacterium]|nr:hypothetical protein [Xanthobacteraceae bacterium]
MTKSMTPRTSRRHLLVGGAALLTSLGALRHASAQGKAAAGPDYAVFTEMSPESKPLKAGWNTRVFTDTDARNGNAIRCDFATGIVTVAPGTYHISGLSIVTYNTGGEPAEMATVRAPASAGYCRLRLLGPTYVDPETIKNEDSSVKCIGTGATANMGPSLFETYLTTTAPETKMLVEHQAGSNPEQIYLRVYTQNSKWHVQARISIRRL